MTDAMKLSGAMTALVTPFDAAGRIDEEALGRLVERQIREGIDGLVPCGTTGEAATLTDEEHARVVRCVVERTAGRVPVVAGCGSNSTRKACALVEAAREAGADAVLVVSPYYNKPNRSGLRAHYEQVARAAGLPVVVYNVPGRTGQNLGATRILELATLPGIVGVKEAAADVEQMAEILEHRPPGFAVLSGDDALVLPEVALGADGAISVVSNEDPGGMAELVRETRAGNLARAREIHFRLLPLMRANFVESNPVPVKTAMRLLGLCGDTLRAPLGPAEGPTREALSAALSLAGLTPVREGT